MKYIATLALGACLLSACAERPENIAAADIGHGMYAGQNCRQLAEAHLQRSQELESLSADQSRARTGDTWGVVLLGLPLSSMAGSDRETQIAVSRGHLQEIEREQLARRCS